MMIKKVTICLLLLSIVIFSVFAYAFACGSFGFEVYETHTHAWNIELGTIYVGIPKSFNITVECKESFGKFHVNYFLEIFGPESLCNDYLRLLWRDTNGADFTIGKDGNEHFTGTGIILWNGSSPTVFEAGNKNNITLTFIFLTTHAIGEYNAKFWVAFTEIPIRAHVEIYPETLNVRSHGKWVTAYVKLPYPFREEDVNFSTVKLWYGDNFVQAKWGKIEEGYLMVKFAWTEVIKMFDGKRGTFKLKVTGLVNDVEFYGIDTVKVI